MASTCQLVDTQHRRITYLRVSVTDRCNLRCVYCMPEKVEWKPRAEILSYEEILRIVSVARELGVRKVRVTGGEPLVRHGVPELLRRLMALGIEERCLTTNGIRFAEQAEDLRAAGLQRVNISLDTLDPDKFRRITRGGELSRVLESLDKALELGLQPRINVVAMRGFNEDELPALARLSLDRPLTVRFIEVMPFGGQSPDPRLRREAPDKPIDCEAREVDPLSMDEVRAIVGISPAVTLRQVEGELPVLNTLGPAEYTQLPGAMGRLGFIASMHEHICERCNRVRLTADGWLKPCLLGSERVLVRDAARSGTDDDIRAAFGELMRIKPVRGTRDVGWEEAMAGIGG
ncbi:MAG: GTP 3',8-cyclase MoaA [Armatimonadetes bacterium]|nr:GTP 3',8-cyclase MoaA [Armatimonadota bacterium]